jgi:hypothetical protein
MEAEHRSAGGALARIAELTNNSVPPDWACPTFRGLYYGLAELERGMHEHVHTAYFPVADGTMQSSDVVEKPSQLRSGKETVLLVEDEAGVRSLMRRTLNTTAISC